MTEKILKILKEQGVRLASPISLADCKIIKKHKLEKVGICGTEGYFAVMLAIPYLTPHKKRNLSAYAVSRDYHLFFSELFASVLPELKRNFPENIFVGFADDSPIEERDAAAKAGLGILGDNGMLITKDYSSYVFLGEIITDLPLECTANEIEHCMGCGVCKRACPMGEIGQCLSALTQKKGELTDSEREAIKKYGSVWGCDRCQELCPHTLRAIKGESIYTDLEFFKRDSVGLLTSSILDSMTDEEFASRAYSWRGRQTIGRNLEILEND